MTIDIHQTEKSSFIMIIMNSHE